RCCPTEATRCSGRDPGFALRRGEGHEPRAIDRRPTGELLNEQLVGRLQQAFHVRVMDVLITPGWHAMLMDAPRRVVVVRPPRVELGALGLRERRLEGVPQAQPAASDLSELFAIVVGRGYAGSVVGDR